MHGFREVKPSALQHELKKDVLQKQYTYRGYSRHSILFEIEVQPVCVYNTVHGMRCHV
jgi:hypothetical protein